MRKLLTSILIIASFFVAAQPKEKMEYVLRYGFINGGKVSISSNDTIFLKQSAIHYYLRAQTSGIADKLYKVDDIYESIVNAKDHLPLKSVRNIKERKYRYYNEITFDAKTDTAISQKKGKMVAPNNMMDILGLYFYMRKPGFIERLKQNKTIEMPVAHDNDFFTMRVNYLGTELIDTPLGKKACLIVAPIVKKGKVLQRDDGLKFYITDDTLRLPVLMEFEMKIGSVKCELRNYQVHGKDQIKK